MAAPWKVLVATGAVPVAVCTVAPGACSSSSSSPSASLSDGSTPKAFDISGRWRICDDDNNYYIPAGGMVLDLAMDAGTLAATKVNVDASTPFLSGPLDPSSRVWTADVGWPHNDGQGGTIPTYPAAAQITFSADATRFEGTVNLPDETGTWHGGREDGTFACPNPSH